MGLQNAQPRFGYDATDNTIFDYLTSRTVPAVGVIRSEDGDWSAQGIVEAIKTGQPVEYARVPVADENVQPVPPTSPPAGNPEPQAVDKAEQANKDFSAETPPNVPGDKVDQANADFLAEGAQQPAVAAPADLSSQDNTGAAPPAP